MISDIRNPWIRRSLVVAFSIPWLAMLTVVGALAAIEDGCGVLWRTWKGRA